jgi:hypothetical protein
VATAERVAIGVARCPCCDSRRAALRLSSRQLAYLVCNTCNVQLFARSERSDLLLRALQIPTVHDPAPAPEPTPPQPAPEPAPAPAAPPARAPAPITWGFIR